MNRDLPLALWLGYASVVAMFVATLLEIFEVIR